jgi:hypothetical protein
MRKDENYRRAIVQFRRKRAEILHGFQVNVEDRR